MLFQMKEDEFLRLQALYMAKIEELELKVCILAQLMSFSALTLLVGRQEGIRPVKTEFWCTGMVICLQRGADLRIAQLMPLPLTVSCFSKIQIGFTFLVLAHPGSLGQRAVKRVCACVCILAQLKVTTKIAESFLLHKFRFRC